ncbi:ubiquitin C-terminal hydrolase-like protein [Mollisia scopiformis]|uniref:Ubiquitin C-terminal hydrolase-like protein n=1 Tax=Mollisia scopiformis TaxID=149040 RepID=A0A194XFW8_MOLSC|nr:ubiquitin C-terminal hydrolase-like protein [Mollisia scopiformis]KUJ19036.1 ubiquitin C-terminal hydrolase-like protein [Mollisia scopiformis]
MDEAPRERAISSEPCSGRPNPFDDTTDQTSRKRQRTSRGGSRSRSVDTVPLGVTVEESQMPPASSLRGEPASTKAEADSPAPSTPTRASSEQAPAEPTSSRVTINLRTNRPLDPIPSSPPSPATPSKMPAGPSDNGARASIESESDALSTVAMETPTSSPSAMGSPEIELVTGDDDISEYEHRNPPVSIIDDDVVFLDPLSTFPYYAEGAETLSTAVTRMSRYFQYDAVETDEAFVKMRDFLENVLHSYRHLDSFYETFSKNQEFFAQLPDVFWALTWRSRFFGEFLRRNRDGRGALTDMLCQMARLAGKFVAMDVRTLSYRAQQDNEDLEPDLSRNSLGALAYLLREDEVNHLGRNLENHYNWNWEEDVAQMSDSFQTEGGTIPALTKLVQGQLRLISRFPKFIDNLTDPCRLVSRIVSDASRYIDMADVSQQQTVDGAKQKVFQGYEFFRVMSAGLETIIEKHVTFLSPDAALGHLNCLHNILKRNLQLNPKAYRDFVEQQRRDHSMLTRQQAPQAFSLEWKFGILKKLITSAQMQLRVTGVTTMCADLLALYSKQKNNDVSHNPYLLYPAEFIIQNQLVDYIVGIGSHPEIINESNNILGFLIVTKTYKAKQTDMIWQTVMNSQDPRVVEAILRMVNRCHNLYDYRSLLYLCKKISDVPLSSFSGAMREYCSNLFLQLVVKAHDASVAYIDAPPYELCVRLIREASVTTLEYSDGYVDLQNFATIKFRELLGNGPSPDVRNAIYLGCIQDISTKTASTAGSICVINALLRAPGVPPGMSTDLHVLTSEHGLTKLLVDELESVISVCGSEPIPNSPASTARRELLLAIIIEKPDSISPELGERLWNALVGSQSKSSAERNISWQILNTAVQRSSTSKNSFLASCFRDHLPRLPSYCFTRGALDFAHVAVRSWLEEARHDFAEEGSKFESPALEQLWHMILTAPANTIDAEAIKILVGVFVDSALILSIPRPIARHVHLTLVDRCLKQLKGAASQLKAFSDGASSGSDEGMVIVASEDQFQEQEKTFARSLAVLREFLRAYQIKPQFASPKSRSPIAAATTAVEGELLTLKYQSFDGDKQTEIKSLALGKLNTAASLFATLQKATGFKNYKVYCGGREINPDEIEVCKSLEELNINGLVLVRSREASDIHLTSKGSLEAEITKHFDDLWSYLGMHEKVAQEIYYFLIKFPVYARMVKDFESDVSYAEIFPSGQPFKSLYAIHCLRDHITAQSKQGTLQEETLLRAIQLLVSAISDPKVLDQCGGDSLKDCLALHLLDCFIQLLKESPLPKSLNSLLDETLLERLLQLLYGAMASATSQNSVHLTWRSFEAILDAVSHCSDLWQSFGAHLSNKTLVRDLLLDDDRSAIRKSVVKHVTQKCSSSPSSSQLTTNHFAMTFWPKIAALIPVATQYPERCEETFTLALTLFNKLANADTTAGFFNLNKLVKEWGTLLLAYSCAETVGHLESVDMVAHGLANLLLSAAQRAKSSRQVLACGSIGTELFRRHLFPEFSVSQLSSDVVVPRIPLLNPATRQILAETIYFLVKDDERHYQEVVASMSGLVPYAPGDDGPYIYDMSFQFERAKSIRSHTGYVGLRNLSNTCYLNSLFTQLFMNIPFREFMLQAHVSNGLTSQTLLFETQQLFGHMQNSFKRYVDPANLASSIRTYEETQIDVTIQMDVDEFYNLLFDRWEGQILSPDAKRKFRSFYGGQLVQQVKSKECPHISERFEPFSAIQCDIKGKSCLQESLQAYVDGEVMEGDNKYKCSQCDRHVDAVKRACLKDIPDSLIFHLKRFDFNLRTLQRSKINDHFSFPKTIDMKPYKVEYLTDSPEEILEDVFELVGILVHAGTAESGHYYSFIRERPSTSDKDAWIEFNDDNVSPWDPNLMESACFGGPEYRGPLDTGLQYDKTWSAYMLFYQRSSSLTAQYQSLERTKMTSPVRLQVPTPLANHIAMENEILMRKYCLFDPSHATFVIKMLSNVKQINGGRCSALHRMEKDSLNAAANHLDQVFSRTKDIPDFPSFMMAIRQICHNCAECCRDYLEWFFDCPEALKALLLRNPDMVVRNDIAASILYALTKVRLEAAYAYGLGDDEDSVDDVEDSDPQLLQRMVKALSKLFEVFQTHVRAWPEYFGLIWSIAKIGKREATLLLDAGFLRKSLEIVSADPLLPLSVQYQKMLNTITKRMASRPVAYDSVIGLISTLMQTCDVTLDPVADDDERLDFAVHDCPIPFTVTERHLIMQHWTRNQAHILVEKLCMIEQNQAATETILIDLLDWPEALDQNILAAILYGIKQRMHTRSFLRAALVYAEHSKNPKAFTTVYMHAAKIAAHVDGDGKEFLQFFKNLLDIEGENFISSQEEIHKLSLDQLHIWAPALLTDPDQSVREATEELLEVLVLTHGPEIDFGGPDEDQAQTALVVLTAKKLGLACLDYMHERFIRQRQTAVRTMLDPIFNVVEKIKEFFDPEDRDDVYTHRFFEQSSAVLPTLKKCAVEEVEDDMSDWDGSDDAYDDSSEPPMDRLGDLCSQDPL